LTEISDMLSQQSTRFRGVYGSPNIIRMIKSRRMRWAEHVA
jgi:hypothetical protein